MKKWIIATLALMMSVLLVACGGGDDKSSENSSKSISETADNALEGKYLLSAMSSLGGEMNYADLVFMEMAEDTYFEFSPDGTGTMSLSGESTLGEVEYDFDAGTMEIEGESSTFELDGDVLILYSTDPDFGESRMVFTKEGSPLWDEIKEQKSEFDTFLDDLTSFESPTTSLETGSEWYGTMAIANYTGPNNREGVFDVTASIMDSDVGPYFEVYDGSQTGAISMYIELYSTYFIPIIDDQAWTFNKYLTEDDLFDLSPIFFDGALEFIYHYDYDGESFDVHIFLRETGTPWNELYDLLPPSYEEYVAEFGLDSDTSDGGEDMNESQPEEDTNNQVVAQGPLTKEKLLEFYSAHTGSAGSTNGSFISMNYDEIVALFGEEPVQSTSEHHSEHTYSYHAIDDSGANITFLFEEKDGVLDCQSVSKNFS